MPAIPAKTYLVVDLRRNQFAARYLELSGGHARWRVSSNLSLRVYVDENTPTDVDVADLSFYRSNPRQAWRPIRADCLTKLPEGFETIPALFKCSDETRPAVARTSVGVWLKSLAAYQPQASGIQTIYLVEDSAAAKDITGWQKAFIPVGLVYVVPAILGDLTGYALLEPDHLLLDGVVRWLGVDKDFSGSHNWHKYVWRISRFEVSDGGTPAAGEPVGGWLSNTGGGEDDRTTWLQLAEVERTGAALFALVWKPILREQLEQDVRRARARQDRARKALEGLIRVEAQLTARAAAVSESIRPSAGD